MVQEQIKTTSRNIAFEKACASAITGEELRRRLFKRMKEWEWDEK